MYGYYPGNTTPDPMMKSATQQIGGTALPALGLRAFGAGAKGSMYGYYPGNTTPGSRIKDPNPPGGYNDAYPDMGWGWWTLCGSSIVCFVWGTWYDTTRPTQIVLKIFGPNAPM